MVVLHKNEPNRNDVIWTKGNFRTCECLTPAILLQEYDVQNAKAVVDSQHHKLYKSRRYTDDPTPATIFANLSFRMNDRESFFKVCYLVISMLNVSRHFLKIQLVSLCLKRDAIHVDEVMLAC